MRKRSVWVVLLFVAVAGPLVAGSPVKSYQEARQVLDAGIQAMGGLAALQGIKDVSREGSGTGYAQGQSLLPDGALVTRTIKVRTFQDFSGSRNATLMATSGPGTLPTKTARSPRTRASRTT